MQPDETRGPGDVLAERKQERETLARCQHLLRVGKAPDKRWRKRAIEGVRFFYDEQWESEHKETVKGRGQEAIVNNIIKPTVKVVLGLMLGQPMDWLAKPVGGHDDDLSEAASAALKYVANRNHMPSVLKRVYWWMLTYGVGWVHVGPRVRTADKRSEVCQIRVVDPREIRLDPQSIEPDISDARFLVWSRKVDLEEARKKFPKADIRLGMGGSDPNLNGRGENEHGVTVNPGLVGVTPPPSLWERFEDWNQDEQRDLDQVNKQVVIHEMYEVRDVPVWFYEGADGQCHEFDGDDVNLRAEMMMNPAIQSVYQEDAPKVFRHVFCGPMLLESGVSDRKHNRIPFLPCFYDRDEHGDPVSFVESPKQIQREVNYRRAKMLHALGNPPLRIAPEVLSAMGMTLEQAKEHAIKPGAIWIANGDQIAYLPKNDQSEKQFDLMLHGETALQKMSGANDHLMGYDTPAESGKSKELSMAQGATMQRDSETNLRDFHKFLGELVLSDIQQEHTGPWMVRITDDVGKDKWLTLNAHEVDEETGQLRTTRNLTAAAMEIEIDNSPWTPTVRARAASEIGDMANNEQDPILRQGLRRIQIQVSDYPERAKILQLLGEAEQQAAEAQQAQQAQQMEGQQAQMQMQMEGDQQREAMRIEGQQGLQGAKLAADQQARQEQQMQQQAQAEQQAAMQAQMMGGAA